MSSCVLVYAGGVQRLHEGVLGVHRPYYPEPTDADFREWQNWYSELRSEVEAFLAEMNVDPELFDAMARIPPREMKVLSKEDAEAWGLVGLDPAFSEMLANRSAKKYGLSRVEYERRRALSDDVCIEASRDLELQAANALLDECNQTVLRSGKW